MGLTAADVMQRKVRTVRASTSLVDLERKFCETRQSGFPVVADDGGLVGVVSRLDVVRKLVVEQSYAEYESAYYTDVRDIEEEGPAESLEKIAVRVGGRLEGARVEDVMSQSPVTVSSDAPLRDVAKLLSERRIHRVPVIEGERLVGILTTTDLVRLIADGRLG